MFVFGGNSPLSYTQVRHMCQRIKADTGFSENITPIRFRTTVLTDIYDQTRDIKQAQAAAGHTTSAMTLKHYVKGRGNNSESAQVIMKRVHENEDRLEASLNEQEKELLHAVQDDRLNAASIIEEQRFREAFILGTKLMAEILTGGPQ